MPRVNGRSPGSPSCFAGSNPTRSSAEYTGCSSIPESVRRCSFSSIGVQPSARRYASNMAYRHTQIGWAMILILGLIIAILAGAAAGAPSGGFASVVVLSVIVLLAVCLVLFISQTVIVDDEHIELRMGPGLIHRTRARSATSKSVDRERLPWWAVAYGIRMSVDGKRQLWRVSGSDAVDLRLSGERRLLITTDEPDALATVIRSGGRGEPIGWSRWTSSTRDRAVHGGSLRAPRRAGPARDGGRGRRAQLPDRRSQRRRDVGDPGAVGRRATGDRAGLGVRVLRAIGTRARSAPTASCT